VRRPIAVALAVAALTCYRGVDLHRLNLTSQFYGDSVVENWAPLLAAMALSALAVWLWRRP
jgi:hypothetical protein